MAPLFGKKGTVDSPVAEAAPEEKPASAPAKRRRRSNELLGSVIHESVYGRAVEVLQANPAFALSDGRWVVLLLDVEQIGGLSEKNKGDEAKGSILQLINADHIEVVATKGMIDHEMLAIVPSPHSMRRVDEYELLRNASYNWAIFSAADNRLEIEVLDGGVAFAQVKDVSDGERSLVDVMGASFPANTTTVGGAQASLSLAGTAEEGEAAAASGVDEDPFSGLVDEIEASFPDDVVAEASGDGVPVIDELTDGPDFEPEEEPDYAALDAADGTEFPDDDEIPAFDDDGAFEDAGEQGMPRESYEQYRLAHADHTFTQEDVRATIVRRFLSEDLELKVDLDEFEQEFGLPSAAPTIDIADSVDGVTDWLGSQVAQMARVANAEVAQLHTRHIEELRQRHVNLISRHIEEVIGLVSTTKPGSVFHNMLQASELDHARRAGEADVAISRQRDQVNKSFDDEAEARANAVAAQARAEQLAVTRPRREAALQAVETQVRQSIEHDRELDRAKILEIRAGDARLELERGKTKISAVLAEMRQEQHEAERALLQGWVTQIMGIIDEHRKNDVARAEALTESLARQDQIAVEREGFAQRLAEVQASHAAELERRERESVQLREQAIVELRERDAESANRLRLETQRADAATALVDRIESQVRAAYDDRINTLELDKRSYAEQLANNDKAVARANRVVVIIGGISLIAALGVGLLGGYIWARSTAADTVEPAQGLAPMSQIEQSITGGSADEL